MTKKLIAVTHNEVFHADDIFSSAVLQLVFGDDLEIRRTRDAKEIEEADIAFDVGGINDPKKNRFDHHQKEGGGKRENGIPYAAFGLVWKKWGEELCGSKEAAESIEKKIVQTIDAEDNGVEISGEIVEDVKPYVFDILAAAFRPTWKEEDNYDEHFFELVSFAKKSFGKRNFGSKT